MFLTNNPLQPAAATPAKLTGLGVPATEADVVTPLGVLTATCTGGTRARPC